MQYLVGTGFNMLSPPTSLTQLCAALDDGRNLNIGFRTKTRGRQQQSVISTQVDRGQVLSSVFAALKNENSRKVDVMFSSGDEAHADPWNSDGSVYVFGDILRLWTRKGDELFLKQARTVANAAAFTVHR
jgi:hypothetical protein